MTIVEGLAAKYAWIWIGLTFGFAAKYALLIKRGVKVRAPLVFADVLLLPMVGLIAFWLIGMAGVHGELSALLTGFCMLSADRLVKLLTDRFIARVDSGVRAIAEEAIGQARQQVQVEQSAQRILSDAIEGRAPADYAALKPRPPRPASGDE